MNLSSSTLDDTVSADVIARYDATMLNCASSRFWICSNSEHERIGGVLGLAESAVGIGFDEINLHLGHLIPPVLKCFNDLNAQVCCAACESMCTIAQIAGKNLVPFLDQIFEGVCLLHNHEDTAVKDAVQRFANLVRSIIDDGSSTAVFDVVEQVRLNTAGKSIVYGSIKF